MIRNWLAMKLLDRNMRALNAGDPGPTLRLEAEDVHFRFPGTSSWAADVRGRDHDWADDADGNRVYPGDATAYHPKFCSPTYCW